MFKLISTDLIPPGGWRWTCKVHNITLEAKFFNELLFKVNGYLKANDIFVPGDHVTWLLNELREQNGWE